MMQDLRDKAQGWLAWVIVGLVGITFVLFGAGSMFDKGNASNQVVATVNGQKILGSELEGVYHRFMQQNGSQLHNIDSIEVKKELLDSLIQQKTLLEATHNLGMTVSPTRVYSTLGTLPFLQIDNQFSEESYIQFLGKNHFTDMQFRTLLSDALLREQLQQSIIPTSFVLANDLDDLAKYMFQKRDFRFVTLAKEPIEKMVKVTDEQAKEYYESHLKDFMTEEALSLEFVHLSLPALAQKIEVNDKEIEQFYQENSGHFSEPASVHVAHILISLPKSADPKAQEQANSKIAEIQKRLKAGEPFEALAKEYSDDKETSNAGGDLSWVTPGEMFPEFEKVAFALEKNGQVSEPLKSQYGFHIVKLIDRKNEKPKPLKDVKEQVIAQYKRQQAEEQFVNLADELSTIAYDNPDSLQKAEDKLKLTIQKSELFTKEQGSKIPLLQNPQVVTATWSQSVKDTKNNSDLIKLDDENYVVVRLAEHVVPKQKPFEEAEAKIKSTLTAKITSEKLKEQADKIFAEIQKSDEAQATHLMNEYNLQWQEKTDVQRNAKEGLDSEIFQAAFSLPKPNDDKERRLKQLELANGDRAIVWLTSVKDGDPSLLTAMDKENYQSQLSKHMGELEFAMYATYLYKEAKVEVKDKNL
jgi:peptidyl-prolyl cis-trans isomerase D